MLSDENFEDLRVKGYTVVSDVMTSQQCDGAIAVYRAWLSQFKDGEWPFSMHSLIQRYNSGHMSPSWFVRLQSKKVFAQIWKTDKLLSSIDAIAIGRPPEQGAEQFHRQGDHWLHVDQSAEREGLHAYQGAVYLEAADEDDWTLHVMEGSHIHHENFFQTHPRAALKSEINQIYMFLDEEIIEMKKKGCAIKRVSVPKGGMVLWDSRLIHANANPLKGRKHSERWRFCVFVSMTPAIWASRDDMKKKRLAYDNVSMTTHWSSQGVNFFKTYIPSYTKQDITYPKELPRIAKTTEAKLLAGAEMYDFNDGEPTGIELKPAWRRMQLEQKEAGAKNPMRSALILTGLVALTGFLIYKWLRGN